jgi:hypothetical protein
LRFRRVAAAELAAPPSLAPTAIIVIRNKRNIFAAKRDI